MDVKRVGVLMFLFLLIVSEVRGDGLSFDFYDQSCPQVEDIVRTGLQSMSLTDPTTPAAMLRLMFHDCQVQEAKQLAGLIFPTLLDPENNILQSEMTSIKNFGIRKRESISLLKSTVELACPGLVSCADILILAARDAVATSGGPRIKVPLGRSDSFSPPSFGLAEALLPPPNIGVEGMLHIFAAKGMTIEESVAIMGAHTIGVTHCQSLENSRLHGPGGGEGNEINPGLEMLMRLSCPFGPLSSNTSFMLNDPTALLFDNRYFVNAMKGLGVLRIDAEMPQDPRTAPFVQRFAADQDYFFRAFSSAFVKLSSSNVLSGRKGVVMVRTKCNSLN